MPLLSIFVVSSDTSSERRLHSELTIDQLKDKLFPITGVSPQNQILKLYGSTDATSPLAVLSEGAKTLEDYGVVEWNCVRVENTDPTARPGEFNDTSNIQRFELTQEEYEKRNDTVLSHLKANKLGRFAPTPETLAHAPPPPSTAPADVKVGARCLVHSTPEESRDEDGERRGTVRFVDVADIGKGGVWVGVELDEPTGKGDGSVNGKRFFTCRPLHGIFVRPDKVTIGDYPELDLMDESDDEI